MTDRVDTVEIFKGGDGDSWYWRRRNGYNNEIVATGGEGYKNSSDCHAEAHKVNGDENVIYTFLPQLGSVELADDDTGTQPE